MKTKSHLLSYINEQKQHLKEELQAMVRKGPGKTKANSRKADDNPNPGAPDNYSFPNRSRSF